MNKSWLVLLVDAAIRPQGDGNLMVGRKSTLDTVYTSEIGVIAAAEKLAAENPQKQVFVFEAKIVFETKKPVIMKKQFTPEGELVPERVI